MGDNFSLNMEAIVKRKEGRREVSRWCIFTQGRGGGHSLAGPKAKHEKEKKAFNAGPSLRRHHLLPIGLASSYHVDKSHRGGSGGRAALGGSGLRTSGSTCVVSPYWSTIVVSWCWTASGWCVAVFGGLSGTEPSDMRGPGAFLRYVAVHL